MGAARGWSVGVFMGEPAVDEGGEVGGGRGLFPRAGDGVASEDGGAEIRTGGEGAKLGLQRGGGDGKIRQVGGEGVDDTERGAAGDGDEFTDHPVEQADVEPAQPGGRGGPELVDEGDVPLDVIGFVGEVAALGGDDGGGKRIGLGEVEPAGEHGALFEELHEPDEKRELARVTEKAGEDRFADGADLDEVAPGVGIPLGAQFAEESVELGGVGVFLGLEGDERVAQAGIGHERAGGAEKRNDDGLLEVDDLFVKIETLELVVAEAFFGPQSGPCGREPERGEAFGNERELPGGGERTEGSG